jgi:hypothetical protein
MTARGFYHERYVRTADGWKIAANRLERISRTLEALDRGAFRRFARTTASKSRRPARVTMRA